MKLLPRDWLTKGTLSQFINNAWVAHRRGVQNYVTSDQLVKLHQILVNYGEQVFGPLAYSVYIPPVDLYQEKNYLLNTAIESGEVDIDHDYPNAGLEKKFVKYFDREGFILYDNAYAAAGGQYLNIYKAKGTRIFWMRDQTIRVCSLHATINNDGFNLYCEEIVRFGLSEADYSELYTYIRPFGLPDSVIAQETDAKFWISALANINVPYEKVFYLEHLLNPIDVRLITPFSERVRASLWRSILDLAKHITTEHDADLTDETDVFKYSLQFMIECGVEMPVAESISFFDHVLRSRLVGVPYEQFSEIVEELKRITSLPRQVQNFYGPVGAVQNAPNSTAYVKQSRTEEK